MDPGDLRVDLPDEPRWEPASAATDNPRTKAIRELAATDARRVLGRRGAPAGSLGCRSVHAHPTETPGDRLITMPSSSTRELIIGS